MKNFVRFSQIVVCFVASMLLVQVASAADYWSYPLSSWNVSRDFGVWVNNWDGKGSSGYHLGQDVSKSALTTVKNARWGYVRFVGPKTGYGNVVIIESPRDFEPSTNPGTWKNPYCQVLGHLRNDSYLAATKAKLGKTIDRGTIVGRLGYSNENGGYTPHLHYGIRKGRYSSTWVYYGYWPTTQVRDQWLKGSTIINNY